MGSWSVFGDFFSLLFTRDPAAARSRRELRRLRGYLRTLKPALCSASGDRLAPAFAGELHMLNTALAPLRAVLGRTILAPDHRGAQRHKDFLIQLRLGPKAVETLAGFSYEALRAKAYAEGVDVLDAAAAQHRNLLKPLEGSAGKAADAALDSLDRFADLCRFDLTRLLLAFDPAYDHENPGYRPKFLPVATDDVFPELTDFYSVCAGFKLDDACVADLAALAGRAYGDAPDALKLVNRSMGLVRRCFGPPLSRETVLALLRAARSDPTFVPPAPFPGGGGVKEYLERSGKRFAGDRDRIARELRTLELAPEIEALFGSAESGGGLEAVAGLDAALDERLRVEAGCSYAWRVPLSALKTFEKRYLSGAFLAAAKRLSVEGFFSNGAVRSRLLESVARLEKCGARLAAFEDSSGGSGRFGSATLVRLLEENAKGKSCAETIERIVVAQDVRAKELVEADAAALRVLAEVVYEVMGDFRKPMPALVSNIKTLAASKDKEFLPAMVNGFNASSRFLRIMKGYMVLTSPGALEKR